MKTPTQTSSPRSSAFTLIELLVVIAVIAILAALIVPITGVLKRKQKISVAQAELAQVEAAIDAYKARYGTFPPDNPNSFLINQLFFELKGNIRTGTGDFKTLDGSGEILSGQFATAFLNAPNPALSGFVNSAASAKGDDDKAGPQSFIKDLKPNQAMSLPALPAGVKLLTCSVLWDVNQPLISGDNTGMNPWRYISSNPTNNSGSYDLWVDVLIGDKTNRVCNWSKSPIIL